MADVYGVHSYTFCDFGEEFTITDPDGEEPKESFIGSIIKVLSNTYMRAFYDQNMV